MTRVAAPLSREIVIRRIDPQADDHVPAIVEMARDYRLPHNVLGTTVAPDYVRKLARHPAGAWYALFVDGELDVTGHLALYGDGDGRHHSLWKIRHLLGRSDEAIDAWAYLLDGLVAEALRIRPGSVKVVMFLSEYELDRAQALERAGFTLEGRLRDFYRLEEQCLIFGRTAESCSRSRQCTAIRSG